MRFASILTVGFLGLGLGFGFLTPEGSAPSRFFIPNGVGLCLLDTSGWSVRRLRRSLRARRRARASREYALRPLLPLELGLDALILFEDTGPYMLLLLLLTSFRPVRPDLFLRFERPLLRLSVDIYSRLTI